MKRQVDATVSVGDQPVWAAAGLCGLGALAWGAGNARRRRQASVEGQREARRRERTRAIDDAVGRGDLAALERVVLDALAERFGDGVKSCATAELPGLLAARGVARADVDAVVRFIQDVEAARYARGSATAEERRILGDAARGLLDRTEHAAHHGPQEVAS